MARTIGPDVPSAIQPVDVKTPDIDLSMFDKLGDASIKNATQNFELYATTTANIEAQKAYNKYKDNPIALSNALTKLPDMFKDLPESVQKGLRSKLDANAISLVMKAHTNQQKAIVKQNHTLAKTYAYLNLKQLADDYFNVLTDITSPESERMPVVMDIYNQHRAELVALMNLTDENGAPLFTETQREKMLMPKEALVAGFKNWIYRADSNQLKEWDEKIFQDRAKFMKDTGIDSATYDEMEKTMIARTKQLKDETRKIQKHEANLQIAELIKTGDEMKAKILEENPDIDKKLVKRAVDLNKKIVKSHWYNPNMDSDPAGVFDMLAAVGKIANNPDTSPDGTVKNIEYGLDAIDYTVQNLNKTNMSEEDLEENIDTIYQAIVDKSFINNVKMLDIDSWVNNMVKASVEQKREDIKKYPASYSVNALEKFDKEQENAHRAGEMSTFERESKEQWQEYAESRTWATRGKADRNQAHKLAYENAKTELMEIMQYLKRTGNVDSAKKMVEQARYNYVKTYNSNWISNYDFDRLQEEFDSGKKPIYFHNGIAWEYQGYQNDGAIFKAKL